MEKIPSIGLLRCYQVLFLILPWSVEWSFGAWSLVVPAEPLIALTGLGLLLEWRKAGIPRVRFHYVTVLLLIWLAWLTVCAGSSTMPMASWKYWLVETGQMGVFGFGMLLFPGLWRRVMPGFCVSLGGVAVYAIVHHGLAYHFRIDQAMLASMPFFADHTVFGAVLGMAGFSAVSLFWSKGFGGKVDPRPPKSPTPNPSPFGERGMPPHGYTPLPLGGGVGGGAFHGILERFCPKGAQCLFLLLPVFSFALFLTFSRAAWLSVLVAGSIGAFFITVKKWRWTLLLSGVAICAGVFLFRENITAWLRADVSSLERVNRWSCASRMAADRPWVGFGPGTFQFQYLDYQRPEEMTRISITAPIAERGPGNYGRGGGAHSEYLQACAELGWPGLLLWVAMIVTVLGMGWKAFFTANNAAERWFALFTTLSLLSFFLHGLVNNFLHDGRVAALVWGQVFIIAADSNKHLKSLSALPPPGSAPVPARHRR